MTSPWPFDQLAITGTELVLRPVRDPDIGPFLAIFPDDFELDPRFPSLPGLARTQDRERRLVQSIWRHRGCWSVNDWALDFGVWRGEQPFGIQTLEGTSFPGKRTVDTSSWIAKPFRGEGFGVQARAMVLAFAFEHLDAAEAVSSAVTTNHASLGVSRRLGYRDNGTGRHDTGNAIVDLQHLTMRRDDWVISAARRQVAVAGFEACRPFFGMR